MNSDRPNPARLSRGAENSEPDSIHHVAINVDDLERAVQWYLTSFSCEVVYRDRQQAVLRFANINLQLVLPSLNQPHVAFARKDAATLGELKKTADGWSSTYLADSSGNVVEIVEIVDDGETPS